MVILSLWPSRARKSDNFRKEAIKKEAKNLTKKGANKIKSNNFTGGNREKSNIAIATLEKLSIFQDPSLMPVEATVKLSLFISLLQLCMSFVDWYMASFLYCFPYSYRSFTLLKALAKSNGNLIAMALKSEKE